MAPILFHEMSQLGFSVVCIESGRPIRHSSHLHLENLGSKEPATASAAGPCAKCSGRVEDNDNYRPLAAATWQAHVYGIASPELTAWCQAHALPLHVFAWRPNYQAAGFSQNALYLLRPDTYIALADKSASSEALSRYFADRGLRL